ncbi:phage integrase N-terminal SAM-like domain-containing protein [Carboxylicivirga sp. M1479]|uniref:phage integrase N-terminal SAM-like domain-containing protein n=1 Tax=Carboxylicivirga sp. M1479 TaxID=2594476 RepID=UPI00117810F3|nr:phage integrase N-terminal SAM-like domain-containing protein [Carboxylicivirga sp. M1479]TRX63178.1 hypothetical protein FNN09_18975 [Carboxylicivirga sp. M1479]
MTDIPQMTLKKSKHRNQTIIIFEFDYNQKLIDLVKQLPNTCWSKTKQTWYQAADSFNLNKVFMHFKGYAYLNYTALQNNKTKTVEDTPRSRNYPHRQTVTLPKGYAEKLEQKRYSDSTQRTYKAYMKDFIFAFKHTDIKEFKHKEINTYILDLIRRHKISPSEQNQRISSIKFYYEKVLGRTKVNYEFERPRKTNHLPKVLAKHEIKQIINCTNNIKHRCILTRVRHKIYCSDRL